LYWFDWTYLCQCTVLDRSFLQQYSLLLLVRLEMSDNVASMIFFDPVSLALDYPLRPWVAQSFQLFQNRASQEVIVLLAGIGQVCERSRVSVYTSSASQYLYKFEGGERKRWGWISSLSTAARGRKSVAALSGVSFYSIVVWKNRSEDLEAQEKAKPSLRSLLD